MRDIPAKIRDSPQLQLVMLKSLMYNLSKSKPPQFCKDVHIHIASLPKSEVYNVDTFNTAFNAEAIKLIKAIEQASKYTSSGNLSGNPAPYKKLKGTDTDTPTIEHRTHCNGCGKQHKPPCRLTYKEEYNSENKPYATAWQQPLEEKQTVKNL